VRRADRPLEFPTLVLGATGGFGGAVANELLARAYSVRVLARDPDKVIQRFGQHDRLGIIEGDVQHLEAVIEAADGCGVIVHAVNYPYDKWEPHLITATANVIAAAKAVSAQVLFPGNVYGLGEQTSQPVPESAQNLPTTNKGEIRAQLEQAFRNAVPEGLSRVVILRSGDYFGPSVRNGLVDPIFGNAARGKRIVAIGDSEIPHQWCYVPDVARIGIDLLEIAGKLELFEVVNFTGFVPRSQREFLRYVADQAGYPKLKIQFNPTWWRWRGALGFFVPLLRELNEISYLFNDSVILDDPRRRDLLPTFQPTPIDMAVQKTLDSYVEDAP
jgi:nucleoside-diphosphate-sugar epimerase